MYVSAQTDAFRGISLRLDLKVRHIEEISDLFLMTSSFERR